MNFIQKGFLGKNDWWMYILMFVIVFFASFIGQIPITLLALTKVEGDPNKFMQSGQNNFTDLGIDSNLYFFLMLLGFIVAFLVFAFALKTMHQKKLMWIITSRSKIDWKRIGFGLLIWGLMVVITLSLDLYLHPENYQWNFKPKPFAILCLVSLTCIPIQTSLEEVLFRGYYMQGMALWLKNKWIPFVVLSVVFGLLHGLNPEVEKLGYTILLLYIASGFFFAIVTLLDEGLELAIGMHAINNISAALLVTTNWTVFKTDALYIDTSEPSISFEMFLPIFILYPVAILIFSKKYGWKNWKDKLFGNVERPPIE